MKLLTLNFYKIRDGWRKFMSKLGIAVQRSFYHKTMVTVLVIFLSLIAEIIIKESNFTLFLSLESKSYVLTIQLKPQQYFYKVWSVSSILQKSNLDFSETICGFGPLWGEGKLVRFIKSLSMRLNILTSECLNKSEIFVQVTEFPDQIWYCNLLGTIMSNHKHQLGI